MLGKKMDNVTSLKVRKATRDRLARFGTKAETFDDIINRLMNFYQRNNKRHRGVRP